MLLAFLCLLTFPAGARKYTPADSIKVTIFLTDAFYKTETDPAGSIKISEQALELSKATGFEDGIETSLLSIGFVYTMTGDIKKAFRYYNEVLKRSRENNSIGAEGMALDKMGVTYDNIGMLDSAFACHVQALKLFQAVKNDYGYIGIEYSNIGTDLVHQKSYAEATENFLKAVSRFHSDKDSVGEAICLGCIADDYTQLKKYGLAYHYFMQSFKLAKKGEIYDAFGDYYNAIGKEDSALYCYNTALGLEEKDSNRLYISKSLQKIAKILAKKRDNKQAEEHFKQALTIAQSISNVEVTESAEAGLASFYAGEQDYKDAYLYYVEAAKYKDSLLDKEKVNKLAQLSVIYDTKEAAQQNAALQKENALQKLKLERKNLLVYGTLSAFMLALIIGALLFRQGKLKANQQKAELEQKQLRAQMNPHFIFNCLNSIQHFVVVNDVKNANKYLSGFALLMRQTLENSKEDTITLAKEIAYLENYLALELMRFTEKFTAEITCADNIDPASVKIPSMIIQPFIENSIRHGLCYLKDKKGRLIIKFYAMNEALFCEIDDNGIGREQSQKLKRFSDVVYESHGMELTRQRLALVSKGHGHEYTIAVTDKINAQNQPEGTTIIIKFPVEI